MMVRDALRRATELLSPITDTSRLDAELLMAFALGVDRNSLLLAHLDDPAPESFDDLLARRIAHEPVAYITESRDFWTLTLWTPRGVLIPRADSETLVEAAIEHFGTRSPSRILDLGTGSGALLLAALSQWPEAHGLGIDMSEQALDVADTNAHSLDLDDRARFQLGDWATGLQGQFDLILCNPPYVEISADLAPQVRDYEPPSALFAGEDGLDDYRRIVPQLPYLIAPGGCAILEIGHTQAQAVCVLLAEHGLKTEVAQDLGARDRAVIATG
jgi:release factor glutamine methyltransferase